MITQRKATIANRFLSLSIDALGRIVSLRNRATKTELISYPDAAEAWRIIVPTGRHTVGFLLGSKQKPPHIKQSRDGKDQALIMTYRHLQMGDEQIPVKAQFIITLKHNAPEIMARVEIDNKSTYAIDEVEFPIIGGLGGFRVRGKRKEMRLIQGGEGGRFYGDVLNEGLPNTGRESDHYVREHETCMFPNASDTDKRHISSAPIWLDLWSRSEGLYAGYGFQSPQLFAFKLEKRPKEVPNAPRHVYPEGTPRWIRLHGLHMPRVRPGRKWTSEAVVLAPHVGSWHAGADRVASYYNKRLLICERPSWMDDFVGWTEISGWLYTGEVFHDYAECADKVIRDAKVTGINFVFYYGHTALGAEGADFDNGPCKEMGGEEGFRRMVEALHWHGIRIMLLDHLHRWVNRDVPEYKRLGLERWAMRDQRGELNKAQWWKETGLSCLYLKGPTPEWIEMCPACPEWREHYIRHVRRMIDLGADALELDTFDPGRCYNMDHPHKLGKDLFPVKLDFIREVREQAKQLNPDFALFAETMSPCARSVVDGFYPYRYLDENGRIHRYLFPQIREQAVLVGNYAYDQVNKALQLGIGVETEIWGLRKTAQAACPELAKYIGEVNRLKRRYPQILMHGIFRDTVGATVKGDVFYSVMEGLDGNKALILRNPHNRRQKVTATLKGVRKYQRRVMWRPFRKERTFRSMPVAITMRPFEAVALLALS